MPRAKAPRSPGLARRVAALDWPGIEADLSKRGWANAGPLLSPGECARLIALWDEPRRFRSHVVMERHAYGLGEYAYFAAPLPPMVRSLRTALYRRLAAIANAWAERLSSDERYPAALDEYLARCHAAGQRRPTPLLLRYAAEGFNCLHRDLYGDERFPIQAMAMLSDPDRDFEGGEFLLVENRARQQSRGTALRPARGELVLFAGDVRPAPGRRGPVRASMRHGVSRLVRGERFTLGVIFHDAA